MTKISDKKYKNITGSKKQTNFEIFFTKIRFGIELNLLRHEESQEKIETLNIIVTLKKIESILDISSCIYLLRIIVHTHT